LALFQISVIIPTHNRAALLPQAVASIRAQTYPVSQIVIVDDGSTDGTREVVESLKLPTGESQPAIDYLFQQQQGVSVARNAGLAAATGEWIAFLDSDDLWLPEKIAWQTRALAQYSAVSGACSTDSRYIHNPLLEKTAFEEIQADCRSDIGLFPDFARRITSHIFHGVYLQALLVRADLLRSLGGFHPQLPVNEDTDLLFRLAQRTAVCYVNLPLVEIDRTPNRAVGLTELRTKESYRLKMAQAMYEKWLGEYQGPDRLIRSRIRRRLHDVHVGWASVHLLAGDKRKSLESLLTALRYAFSRKAVLKWLSTRMAPDATKQYLLKRRQKEAPPLL
jgi:glycosyltransferase involved in cell wall biosynthesis